MLELSHDETEAGLIELTHNTSTGVILADSIDRSAAYVIDREDARQYGILPYGWNNGFLLVAVSGKMPPQALFTHLGPVRFFRVGAIDLLLAQWQIYGDPTDPPRPFGKLAINHGLNPESLQVLLELQQNEGGRLGELAVAEKYLTSWQVAEILSEQTGIGTIDLLHGSPPPSPCSLTDIWSLFTEAEWRALDMVPVEFNGQEITVALTNPFEPKGRRLLSERAGLRVRGLLTGRRDLVKVLDEQYRAANLDHSRTYLWRHNPEDSATRTLTGSQFIVLAMMAAIVFAAMWLTPRLTISILSSITVVAYFVLVSHRLWIIRQGTLEHNEVRFSTDEVEAMPNDSLPVYTILIPARDEANILPLLTQAISRLDYPKDRLDVKLLLEEDDTETIAAARQSQLPSYVEIVVVPAAEPRTKPKALNFGLQRARGEYLTIYDAEDLPEPTQLKKALLTFARGDTALACVQAKLSYFNAEQNLLTRWFTTEYGAWFNLLLPALHRAALPIPLGGTSNHFRTDVLRTVGAWDPYNVTEDADLGIRLNKAGFRTAVMDSITHEEANSEFINWIRQRSRWIKGYLQTWLVHMRHPLTLRRQLGRRAFWSFQLTILGTPLMFMLNPLYWLITSLWFMTHWGVIPDLFPPGIYYLGMLNLLAGNFVFAYLNAVGAAKNGKWHLVPYAMLTPLYWTMMSLASWKALLQLLTRPSHWEKTRHGLVDWQSSVNRLPDEHPHNKASA